VLLNTEAAKAASRTSDDEGTKAKVPKASLPATIEGQTQDLRNLLGLGERPYFNVISMVENELGRYLKNFSLDVWSKQKLLNVEAFTDFNPVRIVLREDIYEGAYKDDTRGALQWLMNSGICVCTGASRCLVCP